MRKVREGQEDSILAPRRLSDRTVALTTADRKRRQPVAAAAAAA